MCVSEGEGPREDHPLGKHLEVPVYKLMGGQKIREAVKVAAWTRPASPEHFRSEVRRAADQGYMVFKMHSADGHSINLDDQYEEDVTTETIPVIEGYSPVPEGPGLGFEVDEDAIARLAANKPIERPRFVGILHMPGGHTFYGPGQVAPYGEEGTIRGFRTEVWEEDGSSEFEKIYQRVQEEGRIPAE